ncbi:MAG: hypothetical protein ABIF87_09905 [Pseudomonadota bacterium]
MMKAHGNDVKVSLPKWFAILMVFCGSFTISISVFYIIRVPDNGVSASELCKSVILLSFDLAIIWFFLKILFYSVAATERGLEANNLFGQKKIFLWNEIVEIRRPQLGVPVGAAYVISKNKDKLFLPRGEKNYNELVKLIKVKSPNLQKCQS